MKRNRRTLSPEFKAIVAVRALCGPLSREELAERYDVEPRQVSLWQKQLLQRAAELFAPPAVRRASLRVAERYFEHNRPRAAANEPDGRAEAELTEFKSTSESIP